MLHLLTLTVVLILTFNLMPLSPVIAHDQPPPVMTAPPPLMPQAPPVTGETAVSPAIEKVSPGLFRFGSITINKVEKSISFPAVVNQDKGLLEYLIVASHGKTHESLLRTDVSPYDLHLACLLLGIEGTDRPIHQQGAEEVPSGDPVQITISSTQPSGRVISIPAEEWLDKRKHDGTKEAMSRISWVYTGSLVVEKRFLAKESGSVVAVYRDPSALVDNASPGGESDEIWFVREGIVPAIGTPATVTIRARR